MVAGPENVDSDAEEAAAPTSPSTADSEPTKAAVAKPATKADAAAETVAEAEPLPPDPAQCRGIAISQDALENAALEGEFDGTDYMFYLEPAGVAQAGLICTRRYPAENRRAGILMTKAARDAKVVHFDDGLNPARYELSFPKEFGYVKSIQHYLPESREHAKYPWSKKY